MHTIKERAVVVDGQIVIRPIMIIALTYDHRLLDGREATTFLGTPLHLIAFRRSLTLDSSQGPGLHPGPTQDAARIEGGIGICIDVTDLAYFESSRPCTPCLFVHALFIVRNINPQLLSDGIPSSSRHCAHRSSLPSSGFCCSPPSGFPFFQSIEFPDKPRVPLPISYSCWVCGRQGVVDEILIE